MRTVNGRLPFDISRLRVAHWTAVEKGEAGALARDEMLRLCEAAGVAEPRQQDDERLRETCRQIAEALRQYATAVQAATLAHLGFGAPRPMEYALLHLCRAYGCTPDRLAVQPLALAFAHLGALDAEAQDSQR